MSAELVRLATRENLNEPDWSKNIEICEVASRDPVEAKIVIKAIKKRLGCKDPNSQVFSVVLLEMLMNNCGEHIHRMVVETGLLQLMVKIVKKKLDSPVREKLFILLDATQTAVGGASGKFPQYYKAYYELVRARVQFQDQSAATSNPSDSNAEDENLPVVPTVPQKPDVDADPPNPDSVPDSSIIEKATTVMEVLREVLYAVDPLHPEGATNEFTLDLMEQCSFEKQRVMHLVMTSCDDQLVSQAIELNEQLQQLLTKHDQLLSFPNSSSTAVSHDNQLFSAPKSSSTAVGHDNQLFSAPKSSSTAVSHDNQLFSAPKSSSTAVSHDNQLLSAPNSSSTAVNHEDQFPSAPNSSSVAVNHEETEDEEEADCLLQRDRKGKACAQAWREDPSESSSNSSDSFILENLPPPPPPPFWSSLREAQESEPIQAAPVIPPPPAKSKERDLFFKEKETAAPGKIGIKLGGLSLRKRNGNGSQSGSMKFNE
ncbi:TOM1-like protein 5 isoform X2 [Nymphaea colorata]|uniref:TOM1-like protein 5 isoform X2 n=1 Tax=Nymphaea colorata TaxID=210225 RepID=UPI00129E2224|nr:TOM1-like protein 5 isoform X2 [Nymphaea colorata]